jgi:uncharacterized protein YndB with AHSA1/START domain
MKLRMKATLLSAAIASATLPAHGKVAATDDRGFAIAHSGEVKATPDIVWAHLVHPETWWNKDHSWSGDAANFSMTPVAGGCFCEKLPDAGFVEHARIIYVAPSRMLRLSGALGPLQGEALTGTLTVTIKAGTSGASVVSFDYVVGGYSRFPLKEIAPAVDAVLAEQHRRLLKLVTTGKPE